MPFLSVGWLSGYFFTAFTGLSRRGGSRASLASAATAEISKFLRTSQYSPNGYGKDVSMLTSTHGTHAMANGQFKPPNVLIYTGPDDTDEEQYISLKRALVQVLNLHSYVVYRLHEHKITTHPWIENTALLVLGPHDNAIPQSVQEVFLQYVQGGGKLLGINGRFTHQVIKKQWGEKDKPFPALVEIGNSVLGEEQSRHLMAICDPFYFEVPEGRQTTVVAREDNTKRPLIVQIFEGHGTAVFSLLHLVSIVEENDKQGNSVNSESSSVLEVSSESLIDILSVVLKCLELKCQSSNIPELTPAFLLASKKNEQHLLHSLSSSLKEGTCIGNDMSLYFACFGDNTPNASEKLLPIITVVDYNSSELPFNWGSYHDQLQTKVLGNVMFYTSVITSTQTVFDGNFTFVQNIPEDVGVVVVAGQQVKGQGRGGNVWLSPVGCMMFSLHVRVPFRSELGSRLPYLQHIASLAAVEAITSLPGYKDIDIRLKWPNDIYFGKARKIGGVIVTSSASGNILNAVIGMGINVTNSEPTVSVNEIISQYNKEYKTNLEALTIEGLMARTINLIEAFIDEFQEHGTKQFLEKYYSRWLHSDTTVSLSNQAGTEVVQIKGLDNFGFLLVQKKSGELCSVQPDGNTFDMLKNLIAIK